jgi:steroid 5-alpha reductase family enzyme
MSAGQQLGILGALMVVLMSAGWAWQRRRRNAGIVDVIWTLGVGLGALLCAATGSGTTAPRVALAVLGAAWAARLALHVARRVFSEEEDGRYRYLRAHWKDSQAMFYGFFLAQAALVLLFALPFVAVARNPETVPLAIALGIAIWVIAVAGESIADRQLARFRAAPANRGRTCREGLWGRSRHPNYFFEWLHWFAYVALAWGSPLWWLSLGGPLVMYVFLRWISGIPFTEAQALRTRGDDYRAYQRDTPLLFPRLRKPDPQRSSA